MKQAVKKNIRFIILLVILAGGFLTYNYLYQGHRDIGSEDPEFTMTVKELQIEFVSNDSLANRTYGNQTIEVDGKVTAFDAATGTLTIDEKLSAVLKKKKVKEPIAAGQSIKIKGRFLGYDDLVDELKMDQVSILK
ncbi:OB-fold protein [Flavobacterium sp.]|uniref:OB-fold protein n=1 Tax=Flavobacterium sp. TaxID=239 RepID=UPI0039E4BDB2